MPELPEVETVRRTLEHLVLGKRIDHVTILYEKIIQTDLLDFDHIHGQVIHAIKRMGKHLIFMLDRDVLLIHLRMEGRFFYKKEHQPINKHEHVIFHFSDHDILTYHDVRKFGTMHLIPKNRYLEEGPLKFLGPEPENLNEDEFYQKVKSRKTEIKAILLDQHVISGLGNIYVDETLFRAKIHPNRKGSELSLAEVSRILYAAREVLLKAISLGGTTIRTFEPMDGVHGRFQNELLVHTKEGEPCPVCGTLIIKMKVKGRGTYVCPTCQI